MKIGLAQIQSITGDVLRNRDHHLEMLDRLSSGDSDLVLFPELSLCNYDPEIASSMIFTPEDPRLFPFQEVADAKGIRIGVGVPTHSPILGKPYISSLWFNPNQRPSGVHKSHIHKDEEPFFSAFNGGVCVLDLSIRVALALCYEVQVDAHIEAAAKQGMEVYLASVAKTFSGMNAARDRLCQKAKQFKVPILVVNSVGTCEGKPAGGGSVVIGAEGELIDALNSSEERILVFDLKTRGVRRI